MNNAIIPCPHCHQTMVIMVKAKEEHLGSKARGWLSVGRGDQSFDFSAQSLAGAPASSGPAAAPSGGGLRSLVPGGLSPGEKRSSTEYRERSIGDVLIPLAYAGISGAFIGLVSIPICAFLEWPWFLCPIAWIASTGITWFAVSRQALDDDSLITKSAEQERTPPQAPVVMAPPSVNLQFDERNEKGRITKQTRATLSAPGSNPAGLWRYCQALAAGGAFPSWEGGDSGLGAKAFGYMESELGHWRREAERAKLLEARPGRNQGYDITPRGQHAFERIGREQLEEASYGI